MEKVFNKERYRLSKKAKTYFKIEYMLVILIVIAIIIAVGLVQYFVLKSEVNYILYLSIILGIIGVGSIIVMKLVELDYINYSYTFDDQGVKVVQGIFLKKKEFLPYNTVQDVTLVKGPILSRLNLADVNIKGINSHVIISAVEEGLAEEIKESILNERSKYNVEY